MKLLTSHLSLLTLFFLASCASQPQIAPRFNVPNTAPIHSGVKKIAGHIGDAQKTAQKIEEECPQAKAEIATLKLQLSDAQIEAALIENLLVDHDAKLKVQTDRANSVVDSYNKLVPENIALKASRHYWVILFWRAVAAAVGCGLCALGLL